MHKVKNVKSAELFPAINELLLNGQKVRITVTGNSMMPFLMENRDSVELSAASIHDLRFGQIALIKRDNGTYILHRVIFKSKNSFYLAGDAQCRIEGPLLPRHLVAVVSAIWRKGKLISPSNMIWRILSCIWWIRLPATLIVTRPYKFLSCVFKAIRKG